MCLKANSLHGAKTLKEHSNYLLTQGKARDKKQKNFEPRKIDYESQVANRKLKTASRGIIIEP